MKRFELFWALVITLALVGSVVAAPAHPGQLRKQAEEKAARSGHSVQRSLDDATLCNNLVCVQTDEDGDFNIGTADGRTLLYYYSNDPWSTDIRVSIDGVQWNLTAENGNACGGIATFVNEVADAAHISDNYTLPGNISVTVTHTVVSFGDSSAAVLTRTVVTNSSGVSHNIGVLYEYDTTVDGDDAATLYLGPNHITVETCYTAPFSYPYWDAIPSSGSLVGRGIFSGGEAVTPDALAFGQWGSLYGACWDYTCSGDSYGDSGVLYRWNEQPVAPGQNRTVATYYGVGGMQVSYGAVHITAFPPTLHCTDGQVAPNPCQLLVNITDSSANACNTIVVLMGNGGGTGGQATISGDNPQTIPSVLPGHSASLNFTAQLTNLNPDGGALNFTVLVTSGDCAQNSLDFSVSIPACGMGADEPQSNGLVTRSALGQNYPNPFNPVTSIAFDLVESGYATLKVFNVDGQEVASLVKGNVERGHHTVQFDASALPSGVYVSRLTSGAFSASTKMLLMK
jgi:hypothetical protein